MPHSNIHDLPTAVDLLVKGLNQPYEKPAMVLNDGTEVSIEECRDIVSRYISQFKSLGVEKGTRVAMLSGNNIDVLHISNAFALLGAVVVSLHPLGSVEDHRFVLGDADIDAVVFEPVGFETHIEKVTAQANPTLKLFAMGPSDMGHDIMSNLATYEAGPIAAPDLGPEEIYRLAYSGGTTGKPKAIICTQRNVAVTAWIQMTEWEWPEDLRVLICTPLSHAGAALSVPTLLRGGTIFVQEKFDPLDVLKSVEENKITCMMLVPTMIYKILDHPQFAEFDLSSLQTVFYGASAMSPARLKEAIEKIGPVFSQFYGQAEAPMTVTVMKKADHDVTNRRRMASCGRPVPWVNVELQDDQGNPVPIGEPGEICVRGPLVMGGYLNNQQLTDEVLANGWLHTGDVAIKDPDGFLRIVDRKKDMIVTGGFNVYPKEIEDTLTEHPDIAQSAVIGVPDEKWGEAVRAYLVPRAGAEIDPVSIKSFVRDKKGPTCTPKSIVIVETIPMTPVGKPDKKELRKTAEQDRIAG